MANLIWELGADSSGYKKEIESAAVASETGFRRMTVAAKSASGAEGGEGVVGAVDSIKKGIRTLREFLIAGGIVEAFKRMYESGVEYAEKHRESNDRDVESMLRLKDAADNYSNLAGKAFVGLSGVMEKFGLAVGGLVYGFDNAADAMDKMDAEARKALDAEKAKKMAEAVDALAKAQRDAAYEQADTNGKINILLSDRLKIQNQMNTLQQGSVAYIQQQTELAKVDGQIEKVLSEERQKSAEAQKKATEQRIEQQKQIAGSVQEEIELLTLQSKAVRGIATGPESERLQQIQLQRQERAAELEIEKLAEKAITGELTPAEKNRLGVLTQQKTKLDEQIAVQTKLIEGSKEEQKAQATVTDEYVKQVEQAAQLDKIVEGFKVGITNTGQSYDQQSTDALMGVRDRLTAQLNAVSPNTGTAIKNADINTDYGAWLQADTIKSRLAEVNQELDLRQSVQQYAARYGESAARYAYGDTVTQRALSNLTDSTSRTQQATEQINQRLAAMGFGLNGKTI